MLDYVTVADEPRTKLTSPNLSGWEAFDRGPAGSQSDAPLGPFTRYRPTFSVGLAG